MSLSLRGIKNLLVGRGGVTITPKHSQLNDIIDILNNMNTVRSGSAPGTGTGNNSGVTCASHTNFQYSGNDRSLGALNNLISKISMETCSSVVDNTCGCVSRTSRPTCTCDLRSDVCTCQDRTSEPRCECDSRTVSCSCNDNELRCTCDTRTYSCSCNSVQDPCESHADYEPPPCDCQSRSFCQSHTSCPDHSGCSSEGGGCAFQTCSGYASLCPSDGCIEHAQGGVSTFAYGTNVFCLCNARTPPECICVSRTSCGSRTVSDVQCPNRTQGCGSRNVSDRICPSRTAEAVCSLNDGSVCDCVDRTARPVCRCDTRTESCSCNENVPVCRCDTRTESCSCNDHTPACRCDTRTLTCSCNSEKVTCECHSRHIEPCDCQNRGGSGCTFQTCSFDACPIDECGCQDQGQCPHHGSVGHSLDKPLPEKVYDSSNEPDLHWNNPSSACTCDVRTPDPCACRHRTSCGSRNANDRDCPSRTADCGARNVSDRDCPSRTGGCGARNVSDRDCPSRTGGCGSRNVSDRDCPSRVSRPLCDNHILPECNCENRTSRNTCTCNSRCACNTERRFN